MEHWDIVEQTIIHRTARPYTRQRKSSWPSARTSAERGIASCQAAMGLFGGHHSEKQKETLPVRETKIRLPSNDGPARSKSNGTSEITRSGTVLSKDLARRPTQKSTFSSKPTLTRIPSVQTRYMDMLLHLDNIPRLHNIMASAATWILLAGYVILPGTFTTLQDSKVVKNGGKGNVAEDVVVRAIRNAPLLWVGAIFCVIGAVGMISLWIRWRANYVWLINRIFL